MTPFELGRSARPHVALIISVLALVVALGGTSFAAASLAKNSVGAKQLKKNAVTAAKVKDGSLAAVDFAAGQLPAGATGATGARGPAGATGPAGPFPAGSVPSGTVLRGAYGLLEGATTDYRLTAVSFGFALASAPTATFLAAGAVPTTACPGSAVNPRAAAGQLCVYESVGSHGTTYIDNPATATRSSSSTLGFMVEVLGTGSSPYSYGTWAVTAP